MNNLQTVKTDVLIVGTEAAGAKAAIEAAKAGLNVLAVTKNLAGKSGVTVQAVATYNAALGPDDSPEIHFSDTIKGGKFINNQDMAKVFTANAPQMVHELEEMGCQFTRQEKNQKLYKLYHYPGHTSARGAYTFPAGTTGRQLVRAMLKELRKYKQVKVQNDVVITDILVAGNRAVGVLGVDLTSGELVIFRAKAVILATGGAMQIFSNNAAAKEATGDGYSMAYRLGLPLVDMEFCQFFPYNVVWPKTLYAQQPVAQLCQNFGAQLLNFNGERFMIKHDSVNLERATRDIVARYSFIEIREGRGTKNGGVYMDVRHLPKNVVDAWVEENHPGYNFGGVDMLAEGIDLNKEAIEVAPLAHFYLGGVIINTRCATALEGLFAAGEVCGGAHGANRLGGNALPEVQVYGKIAGLSAVDYAKEGFSETGTIDDEVINQRSKQIEGMLSRTEGLSPIAIRNKIQRVMFNVSLIKDAPSINKALDEILQMREELSKVAIKTAKGSYNLELRDAFEVEFMLDTSEMHLRAAQLRKESRGAHYRSDYPELDNDGWLNNLVIQKKENIMEITTAPVELKYVKCKEVK